MGSYMYKVTAKTVTLTDGRKANVAVYAYKPYRNWGSEQQNVRIHFQTGCVSADNWAAKGKRTGLVVGDTSPGAAVWECNAGSFIDDYLFNKPALENVKVR